MALPSPELDGPDHVLGGDGLTGSGAATGGVLLENLVAGRVEGVADP